MTSYKVENKIIPGLPKNKLAGKNFIVAHDTANDNSTIDGEVSYMSRNWNNAFVTHFVGGGGRVVQVASVGYVSWGCGGIGNSYAYAQVELCHTSSRTQFNKDYAVYCQLLADLAKQAGIPVTLDTGSRTSDRGIKTHDWITKKLGKTSHTDPYGYLSRWGISKAQFEKDLKAAASGSSGSSSSSSSASSKKSIQVGDKVKVVDSIYKDSAGNGRSKKNGSMTAYVEAIKSGVNKPYRLEGAKGKKNYVGWAHINDIEEELPPTSSRAGTPWIEGDQVKILDKATHYQTGERIDPSIKGKTLVINGIKSVKQSNSKRAYRLLHNGVPIGWVLEQDLVIVKYK